MNIISAVQLHLTKIPNKNHKRRGVAEIIGTLMLMAITVAGASILTYFVNDSFTALSLSTSTTLDAQSKIKLIAYDTRDTNSTISLMGLPNVYNKNDSKLCGESCELNVDDLPSNDGTEFFVFQFTNNNIDSIFLHSVQLNYVAHEWDNLMANESLDLSNNLPVGKYPHDGTYSILLLNDIEQLATNEIKSGQTVNILVKLDGAVPDIQLNKVMQVVLNIGQNQPIEFLIESGDVM